MKSVVNPKKTFDQNIWVVSILSPIDNIIKDTLGGHTYLLIEGIQKNPISSRNELFIGQYDVLAETDEHDKALINKKGHFTQVRCFESNKYVRKYDNYRSVSYWVAVTDAQSIIRSIKADERQCKQAATGECDYPLYQFVGTGHLLSEIGMGNNCASWCIEKLAQGGIKIDVLPKPKKITTSSCCLV